MLKSSKIYVAGHNGMVGSAIVRLLEKSGYTNIVHRRSSVLDLRKQQDVQQFFTDEKPEYVFLAAAKVGGIQANNTYRADFLYENLMIQNNVIHQAYEAGVKKLMFLGSSCIYPKLAPQPLNEESLLTGLLEYTNEPYAIAKISGIKMCEAYRDQYNCNFISVMPTNLYGPNDNYDLNNSHVLPALLRKFHEAKEAQSDQVEIWGTGTPRREFLHADDMASACLFLMENFDAKPYDKSPSFFNIGWGDDVEIKTLATIIKDIVGFKGELNFDTTKPDGTPRKLMDTSRINDLGWKASIPLKEGIEKVYEGYLETL